MNCLSHPEQEERAEPPRQYAPAKWRFRIVPTDDRKRDDTLRLSLVKMAVNGFWQCLKCHRIDHAEAPQLSQTPHLCARCDRPMKYVKPALPA